MRNPPKKRTFLYVANNDVSIVFDSTTQMQRKMSVAIINEEDRSLSTLQTECRNLASKLGVKHSGCLDV